MLDSKPVYPEAYSRALLGCWLRARALVLKKAVSTQGEASSACAQTKKKKKKLLWFAG